MVKDKTFAGDFKRYFFRGLATLLPTLLTVGIIIWLLKLLDKYVINYVDKGLYWTISKVYVGEHLTQDIWDKYLWWVAFVVAIACVYLLGRFVVSFIGRRLWQQTDRMLSRLPLMRSIYPNVKQVTDFLFSQPAVQFNRVVAVEYPRKGIWSVGLATGGPMRAIQDLVGEEMMTVFIPSSPTPFTGYTITVRKADTVELPITIDEALRFTISGGVLVPTRQLPAANGGASAETDASMNDKKQDKERAE